MKKFVLIVVVILLLSVILHKPFITWQNGTFGITHYTVSGEIPESFRGYKIIQLSDLHCKDFGPSLSEAIRRENPNIIVLTGDMIDEGITDTSQPFALLSECVSIAPVYAISGNHEKWLDHFDEYQKKLSSLGIVLLENKQVTLHSERDTITLYGLEDPGVWNSEAAEKIVARSKLSLSIQSGYGILLFHRSNMLGALIDSPFDLVLAGHLHGGQVRLPFIGGLRSPHGNWLPDYSGGKYIRKNKLFIVSRGLGNAVSVPRLFNRPEVVAITLSPLK